MNNLIERKYSFVSTALPADTFTVVEFKGEEGLSMPYRFEVLLAAEDPELDFGKVINSPARFVIHREGKDPVYFNGILSGFEQLHAMGTYVFYRAILVPKLWWLSLTHHNQVFLDQSVPEFVEAVLKDGGLTSIDFVFRLQGNYENREYVCQYGETHLNFVSRWLEREGIYYYFEQSESAEKLIITDTAISHTENHRGKNLYYSPPSGLSDLHRQEIIQALICRTGMLPRTVLLKDYNYRKPSLEVSGRAEVDPNGRGEVYLYGEHFRTPEEGDRLAGIRAQDLLCRKEEYVGDSTVPYIQPGYTFDLSDHYRKSFNRKYLTVRMSHEGSQTGYLTAGIQKGLSGRESRVYYQNRFTAIPAAAQFRPPRSAEAPRIVGILSAKVDASGSGKYAELDDQGRYKVKLPFDLSGRQNGKASAWLRMAQPYAGSDHGMHFPLHKGTEVLMTFTEGHPDRPVIAAAVPNPESPSPVSASDATTAKITTAGGNLIHFADREGKQGIVLGTPESNTRVRLGSLAGEGNGGGHSSGGEGGEGGGGESGGGDEGGGEGEDGGEGGGGEGEGGKESGISLYTSKHLSIEANSKNEIILGEEMKTVVGSKIDATLINETKLVVALCLALEVAIKGSYGPEEWTLRGSHERANEHKAHVAAQTIAAHGQRIGAAEQSIQGHGQRIGAAEQSIQAHGQRIGATEQSVQAHGQRIGAAEQSIQAHGNTIQTHGQSIQAQGQKIQSIGSAMKAVGNRLESAGNIMVNSGTDLSQAGTKLQSAGVNIRDAALMLDG